MHLQALGMQKLFDFPQLPSTSTRARDLSHLVKLSLPNTSKCNSLGQFCRENLDMFILEIAVPLHVADQSSPRYFGTDITWL